MTDEELQQLVERDNLARQAAMMIEHVAQVAAKQNRKRFHPRVDGEIGVNIAQAEGAARARVEQLTPAIREQVAAHDRLAKHHGVKPLPKKPRKVADEPEGLPDDILTAYRGLRQRISEAEHITLSPKPIRRGKDVPDAPKARKR